MPWKDPEKRREYARKYMQGYMRDWRAANPEIAREQTRKAGQRWRAAHPEQAKAFRKAYRRDNRSRDVQAERGRHLWEKHRLHPEDLAEILTKQHGNCYLCGEPLEIAQACIDHDHRICPQGRHSCDRCRRGLAHRACNNSIGLAGDSPARLRLIADNLEAAQRSIEERIEPPCAPPLESAPAPLRLD